MNRPAVDSTGFLQSIRSRTFPKPFRNLAKSELYDDGAFYGNTITPLVHVAIYHGIVHGVGHGQPVDAEIDVLDNDNKSQ